MKKKKKALSAYDCLLSYLWYFSEFSEIRLTFSGPLLSMSGALIVSTAEASCHHELMLMGRHLVWCKGILGFLTHLHRFLFFFFLRKSRKKNGQLLLSLMEACVWTLLKDVTTGQRLGRPRWGNRSQDSPRKELNPHSNCYKQRGEAPAQAAGKEPVVVAQA